MFTVPEIVRDQAARHGVLGQQWVAALPDIVADLTASWSITEFGSPLPGGNGANLVVRVVADGRPAVLKVSIPQAETMHAIDVLAAADGRGYVRLLASDRSRCAMLQESLGPSLAVAAEPPERAIDALCATLRLAWELPRALAAPTSEAKPSQLISLINELWVRLNQPCSSAVVEQALAYAERRLGADHVIGVNGVNGVNTVNTPVVCHGDPHPGNALRVEQLRPGADSGYVFVDPEGFVAEPAYDLGVVLRNWSPELLAAEDPIATARAFCNRLSTNTGIDRDAIWEWGFVERVSSGLFVLSLGLEWGRLFLDSAELIVG